MPTSDQSTSSQLSVIDLFCGAGGLSSGLERAGWDTVSAVDFDADCVRTLEASKAARISIAGSGRTYLQEARLLHADVAAIRAADLRPEGASMRWRPDLLAGGPPCQPFSSAGHQRGLHDPRGQLFLEFVRLAAELKPRFILFENVAGLVTAKGLDGQPGGVLELVQSSFEEIGYFCRFALLNAADYGAPQRRVRLFMIAAANERLPEFPHPTHSKAASASLFDEIKPWFSLGDFLASCADPDPSDVVRPSSRRAAEMAELRPGTGLKAGGIVEANRPGGHWGYRQDSFLADLSLPSRTIRAASTPDFVRLADGSMRRLTWSECAGLQGFPGAWHFQGNASSKFRQIGNAVQGQIAYAIGIALGTAARQAKRGKAESAEWPASFHRRLRYTVAEAEVNGEHRAAAKAAKKRVAGSVPVDLVADESL